MRYDIWMASIEGISATKKYKACQMAGNSQNFYEFRMSSIENMHLFEPEELKTIWKWKQEMVPAKLEESLKKQKISFVSYAHPDYPQGLKVIHQPPFGLFYKGSLPDDQPSISIVGARMCSEYGRSIAKYLGKKLGARGINVISGMALGIDSASHAGALEGKGKTFAVLGCGCDVIYPRSGRSLYEQIQIKGGIISEYYPGTQPLPYHFPERNRIISGLADVLIVVEAKEKSGSLITADFALDQGKDIYAVPGRYDDKLSVGCNRLISQGAGILYDVDEFLKNIGMFTQKRELNEKNEKLSLEKEELLVYSCLDLHPKNINEVMYETGMHLLSIIHTVNALKEKGLVQEVHQNYYCRVL